MNSILAFETSSPILSVALGTSKGEVRVVRSKSFLRHSENLIPFIDRLLKKEKISLRQIDAFAIDRGPGSFTGLRIGFSLLKGFLAVQKKTCYGAMSLDMITANAKLPEGSRLGVLVDARRDAVYSRFYECLRGQWRPERKLKLQSISQLKTEIREGTVLVGDALTRYGETLKETFGKRIHFLNERTQFPSAAVLARWVQAGDKRLFLLKSPKDYLPLYLRASEAEENRRKLKQHGR